MASHPGSVFYLNIGTNRSACQAGNDSAAWPASPTRASRHIPHPVTAYPGMSQRWSTLELDEPRNMTTHNSKAQIMSEDPLTGKSTARSARAYLEAALQHFIAAGRDLRDLGEFAVATLGDEIRPHVREFVRDVEKGRIRIEVFTDSVKTEFFGRPVAPGERERMIREAAYFRGERRAFVGNHADDDWFAAEKEIDERLAEEAGLLDKAHRALAAASANAESELQSLRHAVKSWLQQEGVKEREEKQKRKEKKAKRRIKTEKAGAPTAASKTVASAKAPKKTGGKKAKKPATKKSTTKKDTTKG